MNNLKVMEKEISENNQPKQTKKNSVKNFLSYFIPLVALALLLRFFVFQPYVVSGESMVPSYHNGEYLIVQKIAALSHTFYRGDVVVLKNPENTHEVFLKRIIGLPGETVEIKKSQVFVYNTEHPGGYLLDESYINNDTLNSLTTTKTYILDNNQYFVMGDNRSNSIDSRSFGPVNKKLIIGKIWSQMSSFLNFDLFKRPNY